MVFIAVRMHRAHRIYGIYALIQHLVVNGFINGGYAFLYRLAISYMIYLRQDILTANEGSLMVLGTSFSR
jgi:hypothetical protein